MAGYYHLSVKMISRSEGRSAVACSAYRSGQTLYDERYGKQHDYAPRKGIYHSAILAPEDAPAWMLDREKLWNTVEAKEKRKDAQLARELELGLPHQVSEEDRTRLVESFITEELIPRGMVVDYAIHAPNTKGDQRNWHAHLMTTLRPVEEQDFAPLKDRESCSKETISHWREAWATIQNREFERLGVRGEDGQILRVDHRNFEDQGLNLEPTVHMGVLATAIERSGKTTEIGDLNREIRSNNEWAIQLIARQSASNTKGALAERLLAIREYQKPADPTEPSLEL